MKLRLRLRESAKKQRRPSVCARRQKKRLSVSRQQRPWRSLESLRRTPGVRKKRLRQLSVPARRLKNKPRRRDSRLRLLSVSVWKLRLRPRKKD